MWTGDVASAAAERTTRAPIMRSGVPEGEEESAKLPDC